MEKLSSGVLVKFLQEIDTDGSTLRDHKPVLLQIRSIIPVLRGGDLFPSQGFFLKVSDMSHALYVSLPQEQDEMVLYDKLHLGQLIYVDKLEAAYPVPMLKGVRPLHGRQPCYGNPKDLLPMHNLEKVLGIFNVVESNVEEADPDVVEKRPIEKYQLPNSSYETPSSENDFDSQKKLCCQNEDNSDIIKKRPIEKSRSLSASRSSSNETIRNSLHYKVKKSVLESTSNNRIRRKNNETTRGFQKNRSSTIDENSDVESTISGVSSSSKSIKSTGRRRHVRRSMDATENLIFNHELKPSSETTTHHSSPIHMSRHSSYDGSRSSKIKRIVNMPTKLPKISHKIASIEKAPSEDIDDDRETTSSSKNESMFTDTDISWESLPQNLVNLGKDILRERDVALHAAVEILLEASASQVLLKCLSTFSEIFSAEENDQQPLVDKFFKLENDMARARLIFQSINTNNNARDTDKNNFDLPAEALQLAIERKRKTISWINSFLAFDCNSDFDSANVKDISTETTNINEGTTTTNDIGKMVENFTLRRSKESNVQPESQPSWVKGELMQFSDELENSLRKESTRWFLTYVDGFLDWVSTKTTSSESDNEVAQMMFEIKRVNDWLEVKCKDISILRDSEVESCGRVRNKLYKILLKHAERTALHAMVELH